MFSLFTDRAREVLGEARNQAQKRVCNYISTEHLLVALFLAENTVASDSLKLLGLKRDELFAALIVPKKGFFNILPFSPNATTAIKGSIETAKLLKHGYIGTEHLLLGVLQPIILDDSSAHKVLKSLGQDINEMEKFVVGRIGASIED